ncbi:hypothetical protein KDL01_00540 [Actinospica durhamensis]|uniref:Uncharacterized protein n=1 Tax=Actinospica durhamensis TaxID=1508375 RepID=A0A941EJX0_9ACTN|nr:hypothetical protein [Actinospica durhamensis]MBR7831723.1 hypothetical protein [Actinospica durhamensis]
MNQDESERTRHQALAKLRSRRRRIADAEVERVLARVQKIGLSALIEPWLTSRRGRPATLTGTALLVGMFLAADQSSGKVQLVEVTDTLYFKISPHMRERLGVAWKPDSDKGFEAGYAVVRRRFHKLARACDPSPLPKNKRLDKAEVAKLEAAADQALLAENRARLILLTNSILDDSLIDARPLIDEYWDGSGSVDGTAVRAYAKGLRSKGPATATDPDAAWHVRTGDHAEHEAVAEGGKNRTGKKEGRAQFKYAYEATLAIARDPRHDGAPRPDGTPNPAVIPALVLGFALDKPGYDPGGNAIRILADVQGRGYRANFLAGDRLFNNSEPGRFQLPLRTLGYRPVFDYTEDQLGIQGGTGGANQVEGAWYCPHMPEPLIEATTDLHEQRIDPETWRYRIAARAPYRLVPKQAPDTEGFGRHQCPAAAGRVHCPLKPPLPPDHPKRHLLPIVDPAPSPVGPPKICRQDSITIPPEAGAKHAQDLAYGGEEWAKIYFRLRNSVEGINGFAKDPVHEAIEAGATRRIRGIAPASILLAFQLHHVNTRKLATWADTLEGENDEPPRRRPTRRRKSKPLGTWTPAGHLTPELQAA